MKTYKNLYSKIVTFENLYLAAHKAAKGKSKNPNVLIFFDHLEDNLICLQRELELQEYQPGPYSTFHIYDPKPRMISAVPFSDRVVHHALINIIGPLLEKSFIYDSYANRINKGTHRAIKRFQYFSKIYKYVLKCDIKKYFPSIDHEILKCLIRRIINDNNTLWLIDTIIDHSNLQEPVIDYFKGDDLLTPIERRKGLPIGNLTSQFFANFYLNPLDHFIKEQLRCPAYLRYVDDFALFSDKKFILHDWLHQIISFSENYRLKLKLTHCHISPVITGCRFLGQFIYPTHRKLVSDNVRKFKKRQKKWKLKPPPNLKQRITSWIGHAKQADTYGLLKSLELLKKK